MDGCHHAFQYRVEQVPSLLRVSVGKHLHGAFKVGEEDGDLLALALQSTLRGQNVLGQGNQGCSSEVHEGAGLEVGRRDWGSRGKSAPVSPQTFACG